MSRHSLAHPSFLPDSPQARYELSLRSFAIALSAIVFNGLEIGVAMRDEKSGGELNYGVGAGISAITALGFAVSLWRLRESGAAFPNAFKVVALGSAFSTMLAFSAFCASLTSLGNYRYTDAVIEGSVAAAALIFVSGFSLIQYVNATTRTKTYLLDVITCKEAPDQRAMAAGAFLGNIPPFVTFAAFNFYHQRYGGFAGCLVSVVTNLGLFGRTANNASNDSENYLSRRTLVESASAVAGVIFVYMGIANYMNGRPKLECESEVVAGACLLFIALCCKTYNCIQQRCQKEDNAVFAEEGRAILVPQSI